MTATEAAPVGLDDDMGLGEYSPDAVEKEMESGGRLPPGKYHVSLASVGEVMATRTGVMQVPLKFTVLAGPCKGQSHTERVNDWVQGPVDDKKKKSNNRWLLFASRLGLVSTAGGKYTRIKPGFGDCIGNECVVEIKHEPRKDQSGNTVAGDPYANITFAGVWSLTDPKVKDVPRGAAGDKPTAPPAAPQYNTADL